MLKIDRRMLKLQTLNMSTTKQARIPYQHRIYLAAKKNDLQAAYTVYDEMIEKGILPNSDMCSAILSLCTRASEIINRERVERAIEVFESTSESSVPPTEAGYSCIIRLLCAIGDVETAMKYYEYMIAMHIEPHLRTFSPMLAAFSDGTSTKAILAQHIEREMEKFHIQPTQEEYASLLQTYTRSALPHHAERILKTIMENVDMVESQLEKALIEYFKKYTCERVVIPSTGICPITKKTLKRLDVSTESLCKDVIKLACAEPETALPFQTFQKWVTENSYDVVVDAANIGFFGQNHNGGVLTYKQIDIVVRGLMAIGKRVLIVCSSKWLDPRVYMRPEKRAAADMVRRNRSGDVIGFKSNKPAGPITPIAHIDSQGAAELIAGWQRDAIVYSVPRGSNDDWYWLYAALVRPGVELVTNDLLRDHHFQMLVAGTKCLRDLDCWYDAHVISYSITSGRLKFKYPATYTKRPQIIDGVWFFPVMGKKHEWLLARMAV